VKYMIQIFTTAATAELELLTESAQQSVFAEYAALSLTPGVLDGHQLQPGAVAKTVRVQEAGVVTTDGPFIDPQEPLGGYYLFEADHLDAAIEFASRIPAARMRGAVEIRPIVERASPGKSTGSKL